MKKITYLAICLLSCITMFAQQKNIVKLNISDCVNCVAAFSYILQKDPTPILVIKGEYAADSLDVLEKFGLEDHRQRIIWSDKVYDSLSREQESEVIQFCGKREINRSGLRKLHFVSPERCCQLLAD